MQGEENADGSWGVDTEGELNTPSGFDIRKGSTWKVMKENQMNVGKGQYWHRALSRRAPRDQRWCHLAQGSVSLGSILPCCLPISCFLRKIDKRLHGTQTCSILRDHFQCPPAVGQPEELWVWG